MSFLGLARKVIADQGLEAGRPGSADTRAVSADRTLEPESWIVASDNDGEMRLAVQAEPPWPDGVFRAAALVEVIDRHHRAGEDRLAEAAAVELEGVIARLRGEGIEAWLTC
jgi:hypothetical protein